MNQLIANLKTPLLYGRKHVKNVKLFLNISLETMEQLRVTDENYNTFGDILVNEISLFSNRLELGLDAGLYEENDEVYTAINAEFDKYVCDAMSSVMSYIHEDTK